MLLIIRKDLIMKKSLELMCTIMLLQIVVANVCSSEILSEVRNSINNQASLLPCSGIIKIQYIDKDETYPQEVYEFAVDENTFLIKGNYSRKIPEDFLGEGKPPREIFHNVPISYYWDGSVFHEYRPENKTCKLSEFPSFGSILVIDYLFTQIEKEFSLRPINAWLTNDTFLKEGSYTTKLNENDELVISYSKPGANSIDITVNKDGLGKEIIVERADDHTDTWKSFYSESLPGIKYAHHHSYKTINHKDNNIVKLLYELTDVQHDQDHVDALINTWKIPSDAVIINEITNSVE